MGHLPDAPAPAPLRTFRIPIEREIDVITARREGGKLAGEIGLSPPEAHAVALSVSEVARNIVRYARRGQITFTEVRQGGQVGLMIVAEDQGPGIADVPRAMEAGFSTGGSLGLGLGSAEDQMDEFEIASTLGQGTTITMTKWHRDGAP